MIPQQNSLSTQANVNISGYTTSPFHSHHQASQKFHISYRANYTWATTPLEPSHNTRSWQLPSIFALDNNLRINTNVLLISFRAQITQRIQFLLAIRPSISIVIVTTQLAAPPHSTSNAHGALFSPRRTTTIVIASNLTRLRYLCTPECVHTGHVCRDNRDGEFDSCNDGDGAEDVGYVFCVCELPEDDEAKERNHDCAAAEGEDGYEADAPAE
jgi:hypothetical protein